MYFETKVWNTKKTNNDQCFFVKAKWLICFWLRNRLGEKARLNVFLHDTVKLMYSIVQLGKNIAFKDINYIFQKV